MKKKLTCTCVTTCTVLIFIILHTRGYSFMTEMTFCNTYFKIFTLELFQNFQLRKTLKTGGCGLQI